MTKRPLSIMRTTKAQIRVRIAHSDQGLYCPLTEACDTVEYIKKQYPDQTWWSGSAMFAYDTMDLFQRYTYIKT